LQDLWESVWASRDFEALQEHKRAQAIAQSNETKSKSRAKQQPTRKKARN
jgi:hypothetical protein